MSRGSEWAAGEQVVRRWQLARRRPSHACAYEFSDHFPAEDGTAAEQARDDREAGSRPSTRRPTGDDNARDADDKRMREQPRQQGEGASVWKTGTVTQRVWAHFWMPSAPANPALEPPASPYAFIELECC